MIQIRQSNLKALCKGKWEFLHELHNPKHFSAALLGTKAHSVVLEGEDNPIVTRRTSEDIDHWDAAGKDYDAWAKDNPDVTLVAPKKDAEMIQKWYEELEGYIPDEAKREHHMVVPYKLSDGTDVEIKGTADTIWYTEEDDTIHVWDVKTTADVTNFVNQAYKLKYQFQLICYAWLFIQTEPALKGRDIYDINFDFRFIVLDKSGEEYLDRTTFVFKCRPYIGLMDDVLGRLEAITRDELTGGVDNVTIGKHLRANREEKLQEYVDGKEL